MTISIPDTLHIENSLNYIMSIRLRSDGLSFFAFIPGDKEAVVYEEAPFDSSNSLKETLEEFFYDNPFLSWNYRKIFVMIDTPFYTAVPDDAYIEKEKNRWLEFVFTTPPPQAEVIGELWTEENIRLLFGIDKEAYTFLARSFIDPVFIHTLSPLYSLWKRNSRITLPKQMYLYLHDKRMDVVLFDQGKLIFINSFLVDKRDDLLFYILHIWKSCKLDQTTDELLLTGETERIESIMQSLSLYIRNIHPWEHPASCSSEATKQLPIDLIALSLCE